MWWVNSCSERASTRYNATPHRWYGTPIEAQVRLDLSARGWSGGSAPFFLSLLCYYLFIFYPYLILTLDLRSNKCCIRISFFPPSFLHSLIWYMYVPFGTLSISLFSSLLFHIWSVLVVIFGMLRLTYESSCVFLWFLHFLFVMIFSFQWYHCWIMELETLAGLGMLFITLAIKLKRLDLLSTFNFNFGRFWW